MPDARTPRDDAQELIERQRREITQLREELARAEQRRREVERERDRLKRQNERLQHQLDAARRAGFRQAAPFAKDRPQGRDGRPGRRAGAAYGPRGRRPLPRRVDERYTATVPPTCPDCGGAVQLTRVTPQYQEDLPIVRPVVRQFDVQVGCCRQCGRRVQGRHPLQTSDALGAANVHLGPGAVAFVVLMHTHFGVPLEKIVTVLRERFGLTVTAGGLAQVLHRTADRATPSYTALCQQVRGSPAVTPDETGWRVGGVLHWLWVFATPDTTVYAIRPGRSFDDATTILDPAFDGVLIRDGWAPYRQFTAALHQTCVTHLLRRTRTLALDHPRSPWGPAVRQALLDGLALRDRRDAQAISAHGLVPNSIITVTYSNCTRPAQAAILMMRRCRAECHATARFASSSPGRNGMRSRPRPENIRHRIGTSFGPSWSSWPPRACPMTSSRRAWIPRGRLSASGATASLTNALRASMRSREAGVQPAFPPNVVVEVKRLACERPMDAGVPLARWSLPDLRREVLTRGIVATVSGTTLWRWLDADAIRPWRHRSWLFPRDPRFAELAGPILDLYAGRWDGGPLGPRDFVISADEKTSIQARHRRHDPLPAAPGRSMRVEHEYQRRGAWAYVAAWDVHRARLFGRCEARSGIAAFDRLVDQVMTQEPYRSAHRVFWVMDNGSAHRGAKGDARLRDRWPTLIPVHTPRHASWLNQIEIYFSIVQRKVLTPNDFASLATLEHYPIAFQHRYEVAARPFRWTFTRADLQQLLAKLASVAEPVRPAA